MDQNIIESIKGFAKERIDDVHYAQHYEPLKMSVINTEVLLGSLESQAEPNNSFYEELVGALDDVWGQVCQAALERAAYFAEDSPSFAQEMTATPESIRAALHDNYLSGALAATFVSLRNESMLTMPMLASAAFNKHSYAGYKDEIACLRMLLWAGFDVNAQDGNGMTALHYMASLKNHPFSHPRAVRLLLDAGADPNIQNIRGDTALCYLSGNGTWSSELNHTAWMLVSVGANPNVASSDGATAKSLLIASNSMSPNDDRTELIEHLD